MILEVFDEAGDLVATGEIESAWAESPPGRFANKDRFVLRVSRVAQAPLHGVVTDFSGTVMCRGAVNPDSDAEVDDSLSFPPHSVIIENMSEDRADILRSYRKD